MADQRLQTILDRKASALVVLGPIGFVDNEDDETPGSIFHSGCRITSYLIRNKYVTAH